MCKNGITLYKVIVDDKKRCWKRNLWHPSVNDDNMETVQFVFGYKKKLILSISVYFMLYLMMGEKE